MPGQKWEYLTINTEAFGFNNDRFAVRYVNGQELRNWKNTPLTDFLNRLGDDNWEMVGPLHPSWILCFKRPK